MSIPVFWYIVAVLSWIRHLTVCQTTLFANSDTANIGSKLTLICIWNSNDTRRYNIWTKNGIATTTSLDTCDVAGEDDGGILEHGALRTGYRHQMLNFKVTKELNNTYWTCLSSEVLLHVTDSKRDYQLTSLQPLVWSGSSFTMKCSLTVGSRVDITTTVWKRDGIKQFNITRGCKVDFKNWELYNVTAKCTEWSHQVILPEVTSEQDGENWTCGKSDNLSNKLRLTVLKPPDFPNEVSLNSTAEHDKLSSSSSIALTCSTDCEEEDNYMFKWNLSGESGESGESIRGSTIYDRCASMCVQNMTFDLSDLDGEVNVSCTVVNKRTGKSALAYYSLAKDEEVIQPGGTSSSTTSTTSSSANITGSVLDEVRQPARTSTSPYIITGAVLGVCCLLCIIGIGVWKLRQRKSDEIVTDSVRYSASRDDLREHENKPVMVDNCVYTSMDDEPVIQENVLYTSS